MNIKFGCTFLSLFATLLITSQSRAQNADIDLLESINPQNPDAFIFRSLSGTTYPVCAGTTAGIFIVGLLEKDHQKQLQAAELAGSILISGVVAQGLKWVVDRPRPYETYPTVYPYKRESGESFPSGHTTIAFATATSLSLQYKKWYVVVPAYAWAAGVGYSRIYLGAHYPTDVIGGAVIGTAGAVVSRWLTKQLFSKHRKSLTKY